MKKITYHLLIILILGSVYSCSQGALEEELVAEGNIPGTEKGITKFKYHGITYISEFERNGDVFFYKEKEVEDIINIIEANPNYSVCTYSDGSIEIFDEYTPYNNCKVVDNNSITSATRGFSSASLTIYTRTKYRGDQKTFNLYAPLTILRLKDLGEFNLANQITSMKLRGTPQLNLSNKCRATFFEFKNFQGRSYSFELRNTNPEIAVSDFAKYSLNPIPLLPDPLDDKTNSITFEITYTDL